MGAGGAEVEEEEASGLRGSLSFLREGLRGRDVYLVVILVWISRNII